MTNEEQGPKKPEDVVEQLQKDVAKLKEQVARLPSTADAAKALLSGALPRQRIFWSQEIAHWNRLALIGSVAIWTICVQDGKLTDWRIAWASGLSALLLGFWRWSVRYTDHAIARLYPAIVRYEKALDVKPEESTLLQLRNECGDDLKVLKDRVKDRRIGTRGHLVIDWLAILAISAMAVSTLKYGDIRSFTWYGPLEAPLHSYALLSLNFIGLGMVIGGMLAYQRAAKGSWKLVMQLAFVVLVFALGWWVGPEGSMTASASLDLPPNPRVAVATVLYALGVLTGYCVLVKPVWAFIRGMRRRGSTNTRVSETSE